MTTLSPTLASTLTCPRRTTLERVERARTVAPLAASALGRAVHARIARSIRDGREADTSAFRLPKRVLLREEDDLEGLLWRARQSLSFFNVRCRPWLGAHDILAVERFITWQLVRKGRPIRFIGKLDLVVRTPGGVLVVDWKTGGLEGCEDQLHFYLALRHQETGETELSAQAVSLSAEKTVEVGWDEELSGWALNRVDDMLGRLEAVRAEPYRAEPGRGCHYCPYAHACEASSAGKRSVLDTWSGEVVRLEQKGT